MHHPVHLLSTRAPGWVQGCGCELATRFAQLVTIRGDKHAEERDVMATSPEESGLLSRRKEAPPSGGAPALDPADVKQQSRKGYNYSVFYVVATIAVMLLVAAVLLIPTVLIPALRSDDVIHDTPAARAIALACNATRFPETCVSILTANPSSLTATTLGLTAAAVTAAADAVSAALSHAIALRQDADINLNATYAGLVDDCKATLALAQEHVDRSSGMLAATDSLPDLQASELQTSVSGALTLTGYCGDGLKRVATVAGAALQRRANLTFEIVSNALAVVNALAIHGEDLENWAPAYFLANARRDARRDGGSDAPSPSRRRMLLTARVALPPSLPSWIGLQDRRALLGDSVVDSNVTVALDGSGNFTSVQAAVNVAPVTSSSSGHFVIYIKAGVYDEIVRVASNRTNIMFLGDGMNRTIITGNLSVQVPGITTFKSATVGVDGEGFMAKGVTFRNTAGAISQQAVALRVTADKSALYECAVEGFQDTLWPQAFRQFYKDCTVTGTVDFVFGNAAAVLQGCSLLARPNLPGKHTVFTAQGRSDPGQCTGFLLHNCTLDGTPDLKLNMLNPTQTQTQQHVTFLGRPWKQFSLTVVAESFISDLVDPAGWLPWSGDFALETLYYGEYSNTGPGAGTEARVAWSTSITNASLLRHLQPSQFLDAATWLPNASIPFTDAF